MPSTTIRMAKAGETNRKVCAFLASQPAGLSVIRADTRD